MDNTRGPKYNGNPLITQPTGALEFYILYGTKDQGLTFSMVHRILFYLFYLFSYRLLKMVYIYKYTLYKFILIENKHINKVWKACYIF